MNDDRGQGAGVLHKAIDVLDAVAASRGSLTVADLAIQLDLPRPTVHRIVRALESRGLLRMEGQGGRVGLGYHLFEFAHQAWSDIDLRGAAKDSLERLRDLYGEVAVLGIRSGHQFVFVDRRESRFELRPAAAVGQTEPLTTSALGLAVLSALDIDEMSDFSEEIAAVAGAGDKLNQIQRFQAAMRLASARGYAVKVPSGTDGIASVAAPVLDLVGRPIAAIGILGPASRLSEERLHALAPEVIDAARNTTSNAGSAVQSIEPLPRPKPPIDPRVKCLVDPGMLLGKTPTWDSRRGMLFVADVLRPSLITIDPAAGAYESRPRPEIELIAGIRDHGEILVANRLGVESVDDEASTKVRVNLPEAFQTARFNDVKADPRGRLWLTSIDLQAKPGGGGLFRLESDGTMLAVGKRMTLPSGIAWSPDGSYLYLAESSAGVIFRFPYDVANGSAGEREEFARIPKASGQPDAIAVGADGGIWVTLWDGWRLVRFSPKGELDQEVVLPVPRPTGLCFGGSHGRVLFISTSRVRLSPGVLEKAPLSGSVLSLEV